METLREKKPTALETIRRGAGLSRKELGEISGVNYRSIENYEQRRRPIDMAPVSIVLALAKALDVPIEKILDDEEVDT